MSRQSWTGAGEGFGEISKFTTRVYISRPCRCDRVEQLGGTKMQDRKQLLQLGETERSNVNHIVDMINIEMFTIENYFISLKEICPRGNNKVIIYFLIS